jgi:hypothetical protein
VYSLARQLVALSHNHKKIILYANPGTEGFYGKLGFLRMNTAMAIWHDPSPAIESASSCHGRAWLSMGQPVRPQPPPRGASAAHMRTALTSPGGPGSGCEWAGGKP